MKKILLLLLLVAALGMTQRPVTIHLAGDSTMAEKTDKQRPETGWGEALQQYFPVGKVRVSNHAKGGRSTRTFIEEGRWQALIDAVEPGDFVLIQFAHNDEIPSKVDRYTPPEQYRANLTRFVRDARAKQATPILLTPVARRKFDKRGAAAETHAQYSAIMRDVADAEHVTLIDMERMSMAVLEQYGIEPSRLLFKQLAKGEHPNYPEGIEDNTHFSPLGAAAMARLAVEGMRAQVEPLAKLLREPAAQGAGWAMPDYIKRSDSIKSADDAVRGLAPAPLGTGFFVHDSMTAAWFATPRAAALAQILVTFQAPNGGWSKRIDFKRPRAQTEGYTSEGNKLWLSTLDNGATTEQLKFLAGRLAHTNDAALRTSYQRGLEYLLNAQYPNGCWPQIYPLAGGYHDAITFNDDVIVSALRVLQQAADDSVNVPAPLQARVSDALQAGVQCVVTTQVVVDGARTVWGAQHDPLTLRPVKARAYEHASLSGRESAAVLDFLISLDAPSPAVVRAVYAGVAWLKQNAIHGYSYAPRGELVAKPDGGPLWARFYEIGTNKPIFSDRDGVVRYNLSEIGEERRRGYLWYTDEPATTLRRFERWQKKHPLPGLN